jgi:hypothetical protein
MYKTCGFSMLAVHARKIKDFPGCRAFALLESKETQSRLPAVELCFFRFEHCSLLSHIVSQIQFQQKPKNVNHYFLIAKSLLLIYDRVIDNYKTHRKRDVCFAIPM